MEIMIDIETLGTRPGSVITQIGVAQFDKVKIQNSWSSFVAVDPQVERGAKIDVDTLRWWLARPEGLANQLAKRPISTTKPEHVLQELSDLVRPCVGVWANSPSFDLVLLEDLYRRFEMPVPWQYAQARDQRTALVMRGYTRASDVLKSNPDKAHDAGYDARYQAEVIRRILWT
jgi:hypothetical protein